MTPCEALPHPFCSQWVPAVALWEVGLPGWLSVLWRKSSGPARSRLPAIPQLPSARVDVETQLPFSSQQQDVPCLEER